MIGWLLRIVLLAALLPFPLADGYAATPPPYPTGWVSGAVDWSHLKNAVYRRDGLVRTVAPAAFDLRTGGYVSAVTNQSPWGTCWAFGTVAALESAWLKSGNSGIDISELHLSWFTYKDSVYPAFHAWDGTDPANPFNNGGNYDMTSAILTRGTGPTYEVNMPYSQSGNYTSGFSPSNSYPRAMWVKDVLRLSINDNPGTNLANRTEVYAAMKDLLQTKGALAVTYYSGYKVYEYNSEINWQNHAVAIVGWDDNFSSSNFNPAPPGNGAWIVKNSWGSWGLGGYFYISYYDHSLNYVALFSGVAASTYDKIYFNDPMGASGGVVWGAGGYVPESLRWPGVESPSSVWGANVFTAAENMEVKSITFFAHDPNVTYDVRVYAITNNADPSSGPMLARKTGSITYAGYNTVDLTESVPVRSGEKFSIVVKQTVSSGAVTFLGDSTWWGAGKSFMAVNTTSDGNPSGWGDMSEAVSHIVPCIRAFVKFGIQHMQFRDDPAYDIPESTVGVAISPISVSGGVVGAATPYTFSASGLPSGIAINSSSGVISGTPTATRNAGTATITVASSSGTKSITIAFGKVNPAPTYTAVISPTSKTFDTKAVGYSAVAEAEFTVMNTGNQQLTNVLAALSGTGASSYTITSPTSNFTIAVNGTQKIKVRPNTGLPVGTYTAALKMTGGGMASPPNASLSFTVHSYTAQVSPKQFDFGSQLVGYASTESSTFTITNTGTDALSNVAVSGASAFDVSSPSTSLAVGGSTTFTVQPKTDLQAGVYEETLTVTADNIADSPKADVIFNVTQPPTRRVAVTANGSYDDLTEGYTQAAGNTFTISNTGTESVSGVSVTLSNTTAFEMTGQASSLSLAPGGESSVTVSPRIGLTAGIYTAVLTASGGNLDSDGDASAFIYFKVLEPVFVPTHKVSASPTSFTFPALTQGYSSAGQKAFVFKNTGTDSVTGVSVALSNSSAFEMSETVSTLSLSSGGERSVTVRPRTGLAPGTYTAVLSASGGNLDSDGSASASMSFEVLAPYVAPTHKLSVSPSSFAFPSLTKGYSDAEQKTFVFQSVGTDSVTGASVALSNSSAFEMTEQVSSLSLSSGGERSVTVRPRTGLPTGEYTAVLTASGGNLDSGGGASASVSFEVAEPYAAPPRKLSVSPSSFAFTSLAQGYSDAEQNTFVFQNVGTGSVTGVAVALSNSSAFEMTEQVSTLSLASGGESSVTVRPRTGLAAGTYTAVLTASGGNLDSDGSASASVSFEVAEPYAAPIRTVSITPSTAAFTALSEGYSASEAGWKTFVIKNTGTGSLTAAVALSSSSAFQMTGQSSLSLAPGGESSVTIKPRTGLAAGTYTASLTVSGGNLDADASASVSLRVRTPDADAALTRVVSITPSDFTFPAMSEGFLSSEVGWRAFLLKNTGTGDVTGFSVSLSDSSAFEMVTQGASLSLASSGERYVTVRPKLGLAPGKYTAKLIASGGNLNASASAAISFEVTAAPDAAAARMVMITPSDFTFTALAEGYSYAGWKAFMLKNTGTEDVTGFSVSLSDPSAFEMATQASSLDMASGSESYVMVRPRVGLSSGTYSAVLTALGGDLDATASASMSFRVNAASDEPDQNDDNDNSGSDGNSDDGSDGPAVPSGDGTGGGAEEAAAGCDAGVGAMALVLLAYAKMKRQA
jgi:C1A family cysteine protease/uncharacterized membrane protein